MHNKPEAAGVLTFHEARKTVEHHAAALLGDLQRPIEKLDLLSSAGRVLAQNILADRDFPPFPRATRDGYAVRAADVSRVPVQLRVVGSIRAGSEEKIAVSPGTAVEIMTGAPVPEGTDAVVMIEYTRAVEGEPSVIIERGVSAGENVVPRGSESRKGATLLSPGVRMGHVQIAIAAATGHPQVEVFSRPRVAILSTGDEIVEVKETPGPSAIRNSNSYSLAAQVAEAGGEAWQLAIAPDEPERLRELLQQGLSAELLLLSGGVSMGKYDLVEQVLAGFNAEFLFTGALIQPGKPIVFGRASAQAGRRGTYFFGLPGNPVSTMVTFELFARPVLDALCGASPREMLFAEAQLGREFRTKTGLTRFLPAMLSGEFQRPAVEIVEWKGSGDIMALAQSNCYVVVPPDRETLSAGEQVSILLRQA